MKIARTLGLLTCLLAVIGSQTLLALEKTSVHFLFTSDLHGWLSSSLIYPNYRHKGLLHLEERIKRLKNKHKDLILIDAGDLLQGSPLVFYYQHFEKSVKANPFLNKVNDLGFSASVVGNHDIALNPRFEDEYVPSSSFSWLAANVYRQGKNVFTPFLVLERNNVKIAVLGITTPGVHMWLSPQALRGIQVKPVESETKKWIRIINQKINPDILLGVFHVGLNILRDDENAKLNRTTPPNRLRAVLKSTSAFDLVVSGHDHRLYPSKNSSKIPYVYGTPVLGPGSRGEAALFVQVELKKSNSNWQIDKLVVNPLKAKTTKNLTSKYYSGLDENYKKYISESLPWMASRTTKTNLRGCINRIVSLSVDEPNLDGTFFPGISTGAIKQLKGRKLQRADLFKWLRYDNLAVSIKMSERDISILSNPKPEFGYQKIPYNRKLIPWFKRSIPTGLENGILNFDQFKKKYLIKIADYHFWGGGGLAGRIGFKQNQVKSISNKNLRDQLFNYLNSVKNLPSVCDFLIYNPSE